MMDPLLLAIVLMVAGALLVAAELVLPGGVLGSLGAMVILGGVVSAFFHSSMAGAISLGALLLLTPVGWTFYVRNIDRIIGARGVVLTSRPEDSKSPNETPRLWPGLKGVAVSELRPGGTVEFGDIRVPATSEAGLIPVGTPVQVVAFAGGRATVRRV